VKLNSRKDGRELDVVVKSKEEGGYYNVFVEARGGKVMRMKLTQRAASSN
jgi:hypothetical protein